MHPMPLASKPNRFYASVHFCCLSDSLHHQFSPAFSTGFAPSLGVVITKALLSLANHLYNLLMHPVSFSIPQCFLGLPLSAILDGLVNMSDFLIL